MKTIILFIFFYTLYAQPIHIAQLRAVDSNGMQKFTIGMNSFICEPYGTVTLEEILANNALIPVCKQKIENYLLVNPLKKYFIQMHLHLRQNYHVEFKDKRCIVYAYGQKTISEALLEEGLAVMKPNFNDDEFRYLFKKAQERAKNRKIGVWSDTTLQMCVSGLYK